MERLETLGSASDPDGDHGALVILQSLICVLREKNVLNRADIEDLFEKVTVRAQRAEQDPLPCCREASRVAAAEMARINDYTGRRYGGKHRLR